MSPFGIGALLISALGLVVATAFVPKLWHGQLPAATVRQYWWPGGDESWIRFVRSWLVTVGAAWVMVTYGIVLTLRGAGLLSSPLFVDDVLAALFVGLFAIAMAIFVSGRPRQVVPPWLR